MFEGTLVFTTNIAVTKANVETAVEDMLHHIFSADDRDVTATAVVTDMSCNVSFVVGFPTRAVATTKHAVITGFSSADLTEKVKMELDEATEEDVTVTGVELTAVDPAVDPANPANNTTEDSSNNAIAGCSLFALVVASQVVV
jgi:hypothetical protein